MNGYIAFYKGQRIEVEAPTSYAAQQEAQKVFQSRFPRRRIKGWDIAIALAEVDGEQVSISTSSL